MDTVGIHSHSMTIANATAGSGYMVRAVPKIDINSIPNYVFWNTDNTGYNETAPAWIAAYLCIRY
jgi:hypothetical protein